MPDCCYICHILCRTRRIDSDHLLVRDYFYKYRTTVSLIHIHVPLMNKFLYFYILYIYFNNQTRNTASGGEKAGWGVLSAPRVSDAAAALTLFSGAQWLPFVSNDSNLTFF